MLIEIVGAIFCLLGLGWIYSNEGGKGIILLIGYWAVLFVEIFIIIPLIGLITLGTGLLFYPLIPLQNIIVGIFSGLIAKRNAEQKISETA